jgi:hypothetical protein
VLSPRPLHICRCEPQIPNLPMCFLLYIPYEYWKNK